MTLLTRTISALLAALTLTSLTSTEEFDVGHALRELVQLQGESARENRALELSARRDVELDDWLAAMRAFGDFNETQIGSRVETVELRVGKTTESTRIYLHVPTDYDPSIPAPLLMAFHGTGGDGSHMTEMWKPNAERLGMIVVAPSETGKNDGYAFSERERDAALAAMRWARLEFNIDEERVFATGVSRGGHLSWDLAMRRPGLFAGIAPMIGSPRVQHRLGQNNIRYLENVADLPIRDLQGVGDHPGMIYNLKFVFERLEEYGAKDAELFLQEGLGHSFRMSAVNWEEFFIEKRRTAFPSRVVRRVAREGEGRAYWVEVLETKKPIAENFEVPMTTRWKKSTNDEQRLIIQEEADKHTGRLELNMTGVNAFEAKASRGVKRFRLLLPQRVFVEGDSVIVTFNGKKVRRKPKASKQLLLTEFAERFDRGFLPVAEVEVK